jgi:hypothetical protein
MLERCVAAGQEWTVADRREMGISSRHSSASSSTSVSARPVIDDRLVECLGAPRERRRPECRRSRIANRWRCRQRRRSRIANLGVVDSVDAPRSPTVGVVDGVDALGSPTLALSTVSTLPDRQPLALSTVSTLSDHQLWRRRERRRSQVASRWRCREVDARREPRVVGRPTRAWSGASTRSARRPGGVRFRRRPPPRVGPTRLAWKRHASGSHRVGGRRTSAPCARFRATRTTASGARPRAGS